MPVTVEELRAVMRMEMKPFMRDLQQLHGVNASTVRKLEDTWRASNKRLDGIGRSMVRSIVTPVAGIAAALSVREVAAYADAWTSAKNSLAVAGVTGAAQADVLDRLYKSAQANSAPVGALADLYGKAAQASDVLGASQSELLKFSDGVATSLRVAGTSAGAASGALTQLGQLLGQARVQAEEFNSINEGARPILMAVAHGLDEAGGSVSKLKTLVNDGKVSGQQFFQAFLRGLPEIQKMAANATQTIDQGMTRVTNAMTKYIGETDASLSASQRLVAGLNMLADNFDETADVVLKIAGIIAGALVGRAIAGMIASLGLGAAALVRFVAALRAATTAATLATSIAGIGAAAGPVGLLIGGAVVGSLIAFSSSSAEASAGAKTYADALAEIESAAAKVPAAVGAASAGMDEKLANSLRGGIEEGVTNINEAREAVVGLFTEIIDNAPRRLISDEQLSSLEDLRDGLKTGETQAQDAEQTLFALANSNPDFQALANQLSPLLQTLASAIGATDLLKTKLASLGGASGPSLRETENQLMSQYGEMKKTADAFAAEASRRNSLPKDQLALETEIAAVRKAADKAGAVFTEGQIKALAAANVAAGERRSSSGKRSGKTGKSDAEKDADAYKRVVQAAQERIDQMKAETLAASMTGEEATRLRMATDLLADAQKNGRAITADQTAELKKLAEEYAKVATEAAAAKLQQDLLFERQQMFRSGTEQRVYDTLRSAGIDYGSAQGQMIANQIRLNEQLATTADLTKEFASGLVSDLMNGTSAAEALSNAFGKLGDRLISMALDAAINQLFSNLLGGAMGGGSSLLGGLFGGGGGLFPAAPVGLFAKGGVANKPSIFAEAGPEAAVPLPDGRRIPVDLRMPAMPSIPKLSAASGAQSIVVNFNPVIDNRGASTEAVARTQQQLDKLKAELPAHVTAAVRKAQQSNVKLG